MVLGVWGAQSNMLDIRYDSTIPILTVTANLTANSGDAFLSQSPPFDFDGMATVVTNSDPLLVLITPDELVFEFVEADVSVSGGATSSFTLVDTPEDHYYFVEVRSYPNSKGAETDTFYPHHWLRRQKSEGWCQSTKTVLAHELAGALWFCGLTFPNPNWSLSGDADRRRARVRGRARRSHPRRGGQRVRRVQHPRLVLRRHGAHRGSEHCRRGPHGLLAHRHDAGVQ